ncbi:MAG: hypothetical protein U0Q16_38745 [Bryobacteraceae bacterium]
MYFSRGIFAVAVLRAIAAAQPQPLVCTTTAASVPVIRAEGQTELVGDVLMVCTGGTPTPAGESLRLINIQVFTQPAVSITSRITHSQVLNNFTEALLIVDDPPVAKMTMCGSPAYPYSVREGEALVAGVCGVHPASPNGDGIGTFDPDVASGRGNVYQARSASNTSLIWQGIPYDPPGPGRARILRLTNVRVNATQLGVPFGSSANVQLLVSTGAAGVQNFLPVPQPVVAIAQHGTRFTIARKPDSCLACESANRAFGEDSSNPLGSKNSCDGRPFTLRFEELVDNAFRSRAGEAGFSKRDPDPDRWPEQLDAFNNRSIIAGPNSGVGLADSGTRFKLTFSNVPDAVRIWLPPAVVIRSATMDTGVAERFGHGGDALVPIGNGSGSAYFEVMRSDPTRPEYFDIEPVISYAAPIAPAISRVEGKPGDGLFAPIASSTAPIPRFNFSTGPAPWLNIAACRTTLLFPWVANTAGLDTGIAIMNTSLDPFEGEVDRGACEVHYYQGGRETTLVTPVIAGGEHITWTVGSGGAIPAMPGFEGYVLADCALRSAHGVAFVGDLNHMRASTAYLAIKPSTATGRGLR